MNVLSLCDGMSCGQIALEKLGVKFDGMNNKYFAAEIKNIGIKVTKYNYPNTIHIGDVNKIHYKDGKLYTENGEHKVEFDLVMFGSPCQSFSQAMKKEKRIGLEDKERSGLFLECYRILKEINPKYFLMENVASMKKEDKNTISEMLGVEPIRINSSVVSPCLRDRLYWTNIKNITEIKPNDKYLNDILENGWSNREKGRSLLTSDSRPLTTPVKMFHRYYSTGFTTLIFKSKEHYLKCKEYYNNNFKGMKAKDIPIDETDVFNGLRYLNQNELEKCQTVPIGYTKCLTRNEAADVLGMDGLLM